MVNVGQYRHLSFRGPISPVDAVTGIIPELDEIKMECYDPDIFLVAARICNTRALGWPDLSTGGSGAGLTFEQAVCSGIGEAIERYALTMIFEEDAILGSFKQLSQEQYEVVHPRRWTLFNSSQYGKIPFTPFSENTKISWTRAESLTHKRNKLIPASMIYVPYRPIFGGEKLICPVTSTGAACSSSRSEALLKGICEIVERDSFMIMWRNRLPMPRVKIDQGCSLYHSFQERFVRPGLRYYLIYTTLDLSIPSFFGILVDSRDGFPSIVVGGAAHPDPDTAVLKTLLELVQGLKYKDSIVSRRTNLEDNFSSVRTFEDRIVLYAFNDMHEIFSFLLDQTREIPLSTITSCSRGHKCGNLRDCVITLAKNELEVLAVDLTPVDAYQCGLSVVKVFVPGCETIEADHHAPLLGGYRWREVPHKIGLLPSSPDLPSINPYPHPYP